MEKPAYWELNAEFIENEETVFILYQFEQYKTAPLEFLVGVSHGLFYIDYLISFFTNSVNRHTYYHPPHFMDVEIEA